VHLSSFRCVIKGKQQSGGDWCDGDCGTDSDGPRSSIAREDIVGLRVFEVHLLAVLY